MDKTSAKHLSQLRDLHEFLGIMVVVGPSCIPGGPTTNKVALAWAIETIEAAEAKAKVMHREMEMALSVASLDEIRQMRTIIVPQGPVARMGDIVDKLVGMLIELQKESCQLRRDMLTAFDRVQAQSEILSRKAAKDEG